MQFSIGPQFSREFTFQETSLIFNKLNDDINLFFKDREYSSYVKKIYIGYLCVSKKIKNFDTDGFLDDLENFIKLYI